MNTTSERKQRQDSYRGTWVGVNAAGIIRAASLFRDNDEDEAIAFVTAGGLRPVRLEQRNIRLDSPLSDYARAVSSDPEAKR